VHKDRDRRKKSLDFGDFVRHLFWSENRVLRNFWYDQSFCYREIFPNGFFSWTNRPPNNLKRMCQPGDRCCFGVGSHIEVAQVRDFRPKIRFFCSSGSNTEVERDQWDSFRGAARPMSLRMHLPGILVCSIIWFVRFGWSQKCAIHTSYLDPVYIPFFNSLVQLEEEGHHAETAWCCWNYTSACWAKRDFFLLLWLPR